MRHKRRQEETANTTKGDSKCSTRETKRGSKKQQETRDNKKLRVEETDRQR